MDQNVIAISMATPLINSPTVSLSFSNHEYIFLTLSYYYQTCLLYYVQFYRNKTKKTDDEMNKLKTIEESCYRTMEGAIDDVIQRFIPLRKTLSPMVSNMQAHMDIFDEKGKDDVKLASTGFIN